MTVAKRATSDDPLVRVERVSFHYTTGTTVEPPFVLREIDLRLDRGEIIGVIGPNGSGKTTLARHLNGLLKPVTGRVVVDGIDTRQISVARLASRVGYAFQNPDHQLFAPTVAEDVAFGPRNLGLAPGEVKHRVDRVLAALDLVTLADRHPLLLGYSTRRLVALAGVLALDADLLVLDEPTVGLDRRAVTRVMTEISARARQQQTTLLISHDLALIATLATRVVVLHAGQIIADDSPRAVMTNGPLLHAAGLSLPLAPRLSQALAPLGIRPDALTLDELCESYAAAWLAARSGP